MPERSDPVSAAVVAGADRRGGGQADDEQDQAGHAADRAQDGRNQAERLGGPRRLLGHHVVALHLVRADLVGLHDREDAEDQTAEEERGDRPPLVVLDGVDVPAAHAAGAEARLPVGRGRAVLTGHAARRRAVAARRLLLAIGLLETARRRLLAVPALRRLLAVTLLRLTETTGLRLAVTLRRLTVPAGRRGRRVAAATVGLGRLAERGLAGGARRAVGDQDDGGEDLVGERLRLLVPQRPQETDVARGAVGDVREIPEERVHRPDRLTGLLADELDAHDSLAK